MTNADRNLSTGTIVHTLPRLSTSVLGTICMRLNLSWLEPRASILLKSLYSWLELCVLQRKVIDRADSWNAHAWETSGSSVQQCSTLSTEAVLHSISGCDGVGLLVFLELVFTTEMLEVSVLDYEVGCEHAGCDLRC